MKFSHHLLCLTLAGLATSVITAPAAAAEVEPLRVFIRAGVKTHGPGAHDHPRFLADWKVLLEERGASVDGAQEFPTAAQIENSDVIVFYAANAGNISGEQRPLLDAFQKRGGGLVFIHDAVCGDDPQWFKTITGGAWEHGRSKWYEGPINLRFIDRGHPISQGASDFRLNDEIYWDLHMMPEARILANTDAERAPGSPQIWTWDRGTSRTFTALPGHWYSTFDLPHFRALLLRGIAWAGHRDIDSLTQPEEVAALENPKAETSDYDNEP